MQTLYITGTERGSGKSVIALGMIDALMAVNRRVGFFRPLAPDEGRDALTHLFVERYDLQPDINAVCGCTFGEARDLLAQGQYDKLLKRILARFRAMEASCDVVVCVGTDYASAPSALEFDFNADVANNMGCLLLPVINGHDRSVQQNADAVGMVLDSLQTRGSELLAMVVNRLPPDQVEALLAAASTRMPGEASLHALAEHPALGYPTVGEIMRQLQAEHLTGSQESLNQTVTGYRVAAMEVSNFLDYVDEGALIITPGDRADIILASVAADASHSYPRVAGLLLTGNLAPSAQVMQLLDGLNTSEVPVLKVAGDTFDTALRVSRVQAGILPGDERKIAAALGVVDAGLDPSRLLERLSVRRSTRVTPLMFEYELLHRARSQRRHIVLPEGKDDRVLRAAEILLLRDVADLTLLGDPASLRMRIAELGLQLDDVAIVDPQNSPWRAEFANVYYELRKHKGILPEMAFDTMADVSYFGTMMVHLGKADGMVSGAAHTTAHTIRPAFEFIKPRPEVGLVSSVFFMCLPDRVLVYGDCAVNPNPDAAQLANIAVTSAATARMLDIEPRIAMLSYSTGESGQGEDVERVREATAIARKQRPDLKIEGPIQYDAAVDASVAKTKLPDSEVAGQASVFIFPDLNTGNNTYKAVQRSAGAVAVGPVLQGLNKPVNDLSRGCTVTDIVNTVAITAIQAQ